MTDQRNSEKLKDVLESAPDTWGKWGEDDEIGALNYLTNEEVLRGIQSVEEGEVFSLGVTISHDDGDPVWPSRSQPQHYMIYDRAHYVSGKEDKEDHGGFESAVDLLHIPTHGTTHIDALGHIWYDDEVYNGFDVERNMGGLEYCGVDKLASHGIVGRGILLDIAAHRDKDHLESGERITLDELRDCAEEQGVAIEKHDIVLIRTGWIEHFYDVGPNEFFSGDFNEPGITYSEDIVDWFYEMEIPVLATDTIANEQTHSEETDTALPLHATLLRDQGIIFNEINRLDELAEDCKSDEKFDFLYMSSPMKLKHGTGSPVNPLAIK